MEIKKRTVKEVTGLLPQLAEQEDYDPDSMAVEQARHFIRKFLTPLSDEDTLGLHDAHLRTLSRDVPSPMNVPPHDYSAMDGYALRHADLQGDAAKLHVIGNSLAGHPFGGKVSTGECVRIMTGALIPSGCDTVVMQEQATCEGADVVISGTHTLGQNIRRAGEDIPFGATALRAGQVLRAAELGLLASLGLSRVVVFRKLRIAIFSTGDELMQPGVPLEPGRIYDSNRYTLYALLSELGGAEILDMGSIRDDRNAIKSALMTAASNADVIITSGGVSVGEADYIKDLLAEIGEVVFWKIAMKPGRPLAYGKIGTSHFFGLPGNPVAVMVTFKQFVSDALHILMGQLPKPAFTLRAVCTERIKKSPGRTEFQRGILTQDETGVLTVRTTGAQGSGVLSSMSRANCFIVLAMAQGNVESGSTVDVQLF
ncbi:MAG TPA: gephyrin-like molybdotransferase Glp [Gallionellaceae bacterium]